jgi:hypothetical protein
VAGLQLHSTFLKKVWIIFEDRTAELDRTATAPVIQ